MSVLRVSAAEIVSFRQRVGHLTGRLPRGPAALAEAAHAGLQDSMPRAAVLSIHARVDGTTPEVLDDPALLQVWGPGFSAYVVAADDAAVFTLGRYPDGGARRERADELAARLPDVLDDHPRQYRDVGADLGIDPNQLRYAALTGTIRLHWAGSGKPTISRLPEPSIDPLTARQELARRFLHVYGPASVGDFAAWAGVNLTHARSAFGGIAPETVEVATPIGAAHLLASDEQALRTGGDRRDGARLLPSGDTFTLWTGDQRTLLVDDADRRARLWTPRVWPGALLVDGEIAGTWRRAGSQISVEVWAELSDAQTAAVEAEAAGLPLTEQPVTVRWTTP